LTFTTFFRIFSLSKNKNKKNSKKTFKGKKLKTKKAKYFCGEKNLRKYFFACFHEEGRETEDKKDDDRWVSAVITSLHDPKKTEKTCNLVVINARNYQVSPLADQVPLNDVFPMSELGNKHLGTNIMSCE